MKRLLIIDKEPFVRQLLEEELEERGFLVYSCDGTVSVKDMLSVFAPNIVVLALYMPGNKGWDLLCDFKKANPALPIIIFTAHDSFSRDERFCFVDELVLKSSNCEEHAIKMRQNLPEKECPMCWAC